MEKQKAYENEKAFGFFIYFAIQCTSIYFSNWNLDYVGYTSRDDKYLPNH